MKEQNKDKTIIAEIDSVASEIKLARAEVKALWKQVMT